MPYHRGPMSGPPENISPSRPAAIRLAAPVSTGGGRPGGPPARSLGLGGAGRGGRTRAGPAPPPVARGGAPRAPPPAPETPPPPPPPPGGGPPPRRGPT